MPRSVDPDARRAAIADAVERIAAREGFAAVTVRAVATHLGASTSAVTHYVRSRDELIGLAVERVVTARREQVEAAVAGLPPGPALRALLEWVVAGPGEAAHRFWLAMVTGAQEDAVLRAELDGFNAWWDGVVGRLVAGAPEAAVLADAVDVVVDGLVVAGFEGVAPWPPQRRRAVIDAVLGPLLGDL